MAWSREFPTSFHLTDGRTLSTLAHARDFFLDLAPVDQAKAHWVNAGDLLMRAAYRNRQASIHDARDQLSRALRIDGLF